MKIFDNRNFESREIAEKMTVERFFDEANDNDFLHLGEKKIVVFDNTYFGEDMEAPIFNSLELDGRQWLSEVLIVHIFEKRVVLMIA